MTAYQISFTYQMLILIIIAAVIIVLRKNFLGKSFIRPKAYLFKALLDAFFFSLLFARFCLLIFVRLEIRIFELVLFTLLLFVPLFFVLSFIYKKIFLLNKLKDANFGVGGEASIEKQKVIRSMVSGYLFSLFFFGAALFFWIGGSKNVNDVAGAGFVVSAIIICVLLFFVLLLGSICVHVKYVNLKKRTKEPKK